MAQAGAGRITETGLSLGTPHYMSPEQATGDRDVDPRSDVYALGCVLYEMLSGQPPFSASSAQAVLVKILTMDAPSITSERRTVLPETAENLAEDFQITRQDQDAFALRSQLKAAAAQASGRLAQEITPVCVPQRRGDPLVVETDEHPRPGITAEQLAKLPAPFRDGGTVTAGNASGVNDGAAALIVASERAAAKHDLVPIARVLGGATAGVAPRIMGLGPAPATRKLSERSKLE